MEQTSAAVTVFAGSKCMGYKLSKNTYHPSLLPDASAAQLEDAPTSLKEKADPRFDRLAEILVRYSAKAKPRQLVGLTGYPFSPEAEKHQDHLIAMLDTDEGARRVGEFGIGTNNQISVFTKNMLFDEKIGGTVHLALGTGFPETGGTNENAIHRDFLCDMPDGGTISVDGKLIYEAGKFIL